MARSIHQSCFWHGKIHEIGGDILKIGSTAEREDCISVLNSSAGIISSDTLQFSLPYRPAFTLADKERPRSTPAAIIPTCPKCFKKSARIPITITPAFVFAQNKIRMRSVFLPSNNWDICINT
ncbi:MAG TPA: hypothetical protein DCS30_18110 [Rhizobiales bacterium]|nr:hypothetical protein [Hyphomicrobiales bacterium]